MLTKTLVVSKSCNNRCINCFILKKSNHITTYSEAHLKNRLLFFKKKYGNLATISLTGGEPTLNTDLFKILKEIRLLFPDTEIAILTNGRMFFYKDYVTQFYDLNIRNAKVVIPIYGHTASLHDSVTQVQESFNQTIQGIKNLLEKNIWIELRVIINKFNYRYLNEITTYVFNEFNNILYLVFIVMELNKDIVDTGVVIKYSEFVPYLKEAIEHSDSNKNKIKLYHFPLCIIEPKYWSLIYKSIEDYKLTFSEQCNMCSYKRDCMGILKTYMRYVGDKEFAPIR